MMENEQENWKTLFDRISMDKKLFCCFFDGGISIQKIGLQGKQ